MLRHLFSLTWRFFAARKGRALFSVLGVALGIMLMTTMHILVVSMEHVVEQSIQQQHGNYDVMAGYQSHEKYFTAKQVESIAREPGVADIAPTLYPYIGLESAIDDPLAQDIIGLPTYVGLRDIPLSKELTHLRLAKGHFPKAGEAVFSTKYLKAKGLSIGSEVELPFPPYGKQKVRVAGEFVRDERANYFILFNYDWLQQITNNEGHTTAILLKLGKGTDKQRLSSHLRAAYPDIIIDLRIAQDKARDNLGGLKPIVHGLSIAALIASALIVVSTLFISMQERHHDLATLRLLGAQPKQIRTLILQESLVIGLAATLVGTGLGMACSFALKSAAAIWIDMPLVTIVFPWKQLLLSGGGAIVLILLAGLIPATLAGQLSPIDAYRLEAPQPSGYNKWKRWAILILLTLSIAVSIGNYLFQGPYWVYLLCGLGVLVAMFLGIPPMLQATVTIMTVLTRPFSGSEGKLAGRNVLRHGRRNALIAGILTLAITLALVGSMILTFINNNMEKEIAEKYPLDLLLDTAHGSFSGFSPDLYKQIKKIPDVEVIGFQNPISIMTTNLNVDQLHPNYRDKVQYVRGPDDKRQLSYGLFGIETEQIKKLLPIKVLAGTFDAEALRRGGVVISQYNAENLGYRVGDTITFHRTVPPPAIPTVAKNSPEIALKVVGIVDRMPTRGRDDSQHIYTDARYIREQFGEVSLQQLSVKMTSPHKGKVKERIETLLQQPEFSDVVLYDRDEEMQMIKQQFLQRWLLLMATFTMMTVIALLGLFNNMASSVRERSRELAVLRAIGSEPRQLTRLILIEGMLVATAGGIIGVLSSTIFGHQILGAMDASHDVFPTTWLLVTLLLSPLVGLLVSLVPAMWVAKLDVLKAMQRT
ncbi:ABC transporter permease [Numidum massiliense]|uniref:ABC transporter permease n=1 Tax=Numidum massiliense TaxID=1522315 RepID=UPI0006D57679|nr:ABC transporter permease [Numidum massiliense]